MPAPPCGGTVAPTLKGPDACVLTSSNFARALEVGVGFPLAATARSEPTDEHDRRRVGRALGSVWFRQPSRHGALDGLAPRPGNLAVSVVSLLRGLKGNSSILSSCVSRSYPNAVTSAAGA